MKTRSDAHDASLQPTVLARRVEMIVAEIRARGFCLVPGVFKRRRCEAAAATLRRLVQAEKATNLRPSGHQRILHLAMKQQTLLHFVAHPLVLAVWRSYLGADMICSSYTGNVLWPGCTEQYWHVDHPYWTVAQPYPVEPPLAGQTIVMIDDFTVDNGATAAIVQSHRRPFLPDIGAGWADDASIIAGRRGGAIFMDGALWHTSRPNISRKMRCALLAKYIRSFCVTQEDMRMQLAAIRRPNRTLRHLFGESQYSPTRGFPY